MDGLFKKIVTDGKNRLKSLYDSDQKKAGLNWIRIRRLKYKAANTEASYNLNGHQLYYNNGIELLHSLREIYIDEIYKMKLTSSAPHLLDCGANIGLSVIYLKQLFPEASITAFEPDEANFRLLKKNTQNLSRVKLMQEAIWKENTFIEFEGGGTLSSKIADSRSSQTVKVKAARLKDYLQQPVDFLKLDIEGAEYEVIKDCADDIGKVENLFIEYHGSFSEQDELTDMLGILNRSGFSYYIKEASSVYPTPFYRQGEHTYDVQLNIFCFKI